MKKKESYLFKRKATLIELIKFNPSSNRMPLKMKNGSKALHFPPILNSSFKASPYKFRIIPITNSKLKKKEN
jgi:hypothetical protein